MAASSAPGDSSRRISWVNRLLAPLALIAVLVAIVVIVQSNTGDGSKTEPDPSAKTNSEGSGGDGEGAENPKTYTVEEGDTLSGVAAKFGVSVKRLERLNPDVDPQTIAAGQELTIR